MSSTRHLLDALSPTPIIQLTHPLTPSARDVARRRGQVRRQVSSCTSCHLHSSLDDSLGCPVPFRAPTAPASPRFVVLGEAPEPDDARKGRLFSGDTGKLLRALLNEAGFDPDDDVLYANVVSCPTSLDKPRSPSDVEIRACRDNMLDQVELAHVPFVLMIGAKALNQFRADLSITKHHGRLFVWNELYVVMGIIHPGAVLKGAKQYRKVIREDLEFWMGVVTEWESGGDVLGLVDDRCVVCGERNARVWFDRDAVAYCPKHRERFAKEWEKERLKWVNQIEQLTF